MKKLTQKEEHGRRQKELFSKCVFLLNRETPISILQHYILSFGGVFVTDEDDQTKLKVTHHVVDRPIVGKLD